MADLALVTAGVTQVEESIDQSRSKPAGVDITAGQAIVEDATTGKWVLADADAAGKYDRIYIAMRSAKAGTALTGLRQGLFGGYDLSGLAYNAPVYLSDTAGALADAQGTNARIVGRVTSAWGQPVGTAADKLLYLNCP